MSKEKLDIVIIADFCSAFDGKSNNRFIYLSSLLIQNGQDVEIITSDFFHGNKKKFPNTIEEYGGAKVTMLRETPYKKNISIKRFFSHYGWGKRVGKYLRNRKKPDVIYCAMPTLKAAKEAGKYCKKNKIKFIIDVQDLWPEAYKMVFNVPILSSLLFFPFDFIANSAYKNADQIIAVSQTYVDRAKSVNKKVAEGHAVFLGTDLSQFDKNVAEAQLIEKSEKEIWVGYCGTLGASYDLKIVFDAMRILNDPTLRFVVMGEGPKRKEFEEYSKGLNVLFTGRLPYRDMCGVLSECDIVVNPIMHNAAQSIINKHADYAASGKPVINTQESEEYRSLVDEYDMGFNVDNGDARALARKLDFLIGGKSRREQMGRNSRKCALAVFDRRRTYQDIIDCILGDK